MKPKLPLCLLAALFPLCSYSVTYGGIGQAIDLKDANVSYDKIEETLDSSGVPFSIDHSTVHVTGSINLLNRQGSISNGSKVTTGQSVQIGGGSFNLNNSEWEIGGYLTITDCSPSPGCPMTLDNATLNVAGSLSVNYSSSMTLKGNSSVTAGGSFSLSSTASKAAVLNLDGKGVVFNVNSVSINSANKINAQLNINGASFVSNGKASLDGCDINLQEEGTITSASLIVSNFANIVLTEQTSIATTGSLSFTSYKSDATFTANGASLTSTDGNISLNAITKERYSLTDTTITAKSITLNESVGSSTHSAEFSSVYMKADSFNVTGGGSGQIILSGSTTADFGSSLISERGNLLIEKGANIKLGNLTLGSDEYFPNGHLTVNGNDKVLAGTTNLIRSGSSLDIQNGGKMLMGTDTDTSGVSDCSLFIAQGATLTAEKGAQITVDGSLVVASGGALWTGDTTGADSLTTTTGINGKIVLQDGATVGSYVHDTGPNQITKSQIVDSMKAGFGNNDNVQYLYRIGCNVNLGSLCVDANEIVEAVAGCNVTINTIDESAHVRVTGGTVDIVSATSDADTPVTIGSYNDNTVTNTSSAAVRLDASTQDKVTIKADSGNGQLMTASGETTVISSNVTIEAATVSVTGTDSAETTMVNNGKLNANVVVENGATVKGSGIFNNGITLNTGNLVVGNSPGLMTINGITNINAGQAVFSIAGTTAATAGNNGWGSSTYSNMLVQSGEFIWLGTTQLTLEMAASFAPAEGTQLSFNLMKFIVTDKDGNPATTVIQIGNTNLLANENGTIDGITIGFSDKSDVDGTSLHPWMKDMQLNYTTTTDATGKYITVTLNATAGIPEPSSAVLGVIALAGMALRRKRHR